MEGSQDERGKRMPLFWPMIDFLAEFVMARGGNKKDLSG
jgi:hypothetical protein